MSANLENKKQVVEEIKQKISSAKSLAFVDYRGLTVEDDTTMRNEFRKVGAEYKVYKNRLVMRALEELGITGVELDGTNALALGYTDEVAPAKIVCDMQDKNQKLTVKFGILNGRVVSKEDIEALAKLPSKEVLIAKLLATLNAPASNLVSVLSAPTRGLAVALSAIANK